MSRNLILSLFILVALAPAAFGQESLSLRYGAHDNYDRLVFDWPAQTAYTVFETEPGVIHVDFARSADLLFNEVTYGPDKPIREISRISPVEDNLKVRIKLEPGARHRHFTVGSRIVFDIFHAEGSAGKPEERKDPAPEAAQRPAPSQPKPVPVTKPVPGPEKPAVPETAKVQKAPVPAIEKQPLPAPKQEKTILEEMAAAQKAAHVINLALTEVVNLAVFRRGDWLWIITDKPDSSVMPEVAGPDKARFTPFTRHKLKGGAAFKTRIPENLKDMNIYGEGGGLVWRIVITPQQYNRQPVPMERIFDKADMVRGGTASWAFAATSKVLELTDPSIGDVLKVVTVGNAGEYAGTARDMVDFNTFLSPVGLVIQPMADDLEVSVDDKGVVVTRPGGLALSRVKDVRRRLIRENIQENYLTRPGEEGAQETGLRRIFDFDRWLMGGIQALRENERVLLSHTAYKDTQGRVQDLLTLAKMNLANDRGHEALGFLDYARDLLPGIEQSVEYKALLGAANAVAGKYNEAVTQLMDPALDGYGELDYWRTYTLAWLEDWRQAATRMPEDFTLLMTYPNALLQRVGLKLTEVALREGDVVTAKGILAALKKNPDDLQPAVKAGIEYLEGEAHRQQGEYQEARSLWEPLTKGKDDFYRARAGLALTMMERERGNMSLEKAIDRLEGLRYAWRGDELEARINFMLGQLYQEQDNYLKGFSILRDAASMSPESDIGEDITEYMKNSFRDIMLYEPDMSPLDAVAVYESFPELTPTGQEGHELVRKLAERLVTTDLLGRAAKLLQHELDYRLEAADAKASASQRLGEIYLMDSKAQQALDALNRARPYYSRSLKGKEQTAKLLEIDLLRAKALSRLNKPEEALDILNSYDPLPVVNRMRADIAWKAGLWEDAAEALQDMIMDEALAPNRPLSTAQAEIILNRAVALNLASDRVALATMRSRYESAMQKTPKGQLFDVVTHPRKTSIFGDRETIENLASEVDIFEGFLDSYRSDRSASTN